MKKITSTFFLLILPALLYSQDIEVSGSVSDDLGQPLPGVNIIVKNTTIGTSSNADGNFSMDVPSLQDTLIFSFIGYQTRTIPINGRTEINVEMQPMALSGDEVVVIGYGTAQKKDLTGSVSSIGQESINNLPVSSIDQKMVGQLAGVQINQVTGAPGGGTSVKIRGAGSLGAGNEPLYVVDGVPYSSGMNQRLNPLANINPDDIESVDVLKDASSTAIYGSRGANGVIMITTKNADLNRTEITISSRIGVQDVPQRNRQEMMNAREFAEYQREHIATQLRINENREATEADYPEEYQNLDQIGEGTIWYDTILRSAPVQDHYFNIMKGTEDSRFTFSAGYRNQEGVLYNSGLQRYTGKLSYETNISEALKVSASLLPSFLDQAQAYTDATRSDAIGFSFMANPVLSAYDNNGELVSFLNSPQNKYHTALGFPNPLFLLKEREQNRTSFNNIGTAFVDWEIIPTLNAKSFVSTTFTTVDFELYIPSTVGAYSSPPRPNTGRSFTNRRRSFEWLTENTLTFKETFENHEFDALLGFTAQKSSSNGVGFTGFPHPTDLVETINAAQTISSWNQNINEWSMISYLGRINYSYKDKYLLTATYRVDGSSRFGANNRYASFPSVAVAWNVANEGFLNNSNVIDNMKLRVSYGKTGNNNIGNYSAIGSINSGSYIIGGTEVQGTSPGLSNPSLTWEQSSEVNVGIDLALLNNRLSFVVDLYNRKSSKMLLNNEIPAITGFNNKTVNKGNVRNRGIEFAIDGTPLLSSNFNWNINLNISANRNKVLATNENNDVIRAGRLFGLPTNITMVGEPIGQLYGLVWDGLLTAEDMNDPSVPKHPLSYEGGNKFKDINGDGRISDITDYAIIGNPYPDFTFGVTNSFSYKSFNLSIAMQGQYGADIVDGMHASIDNLSGAHNLRKEWVNRWRSPDNPGDGKHAGVGPTEGWAWKINSQFVQDASYLRISNLTLGYSLPQKWLTAIGSRGSQLYISVQNLATFTKYTAGNPEGQSVRANNTLAPGFDYNSYPLARVTSIGFNMSF